MERWSQRAAAQREGRAANTVTEPLRASFKHKSQANSITTMIHKNKSSDLSLGRR